MTTRKTTGAIILLLFLLFSMAGCQQGNTSEPEQSDTSGSEKIYEDSRLMLGTYVTIRIFDHGSEALLESVFDRLSEIESKMTVNEAESEVIAVNREAGKGFVQVSSDTYQVIQTALEYAGKSKGHFDPTVGGLVNLWGIGTERANVPDQAEVEEAVQTVGFKNVELADEDHSVFLKTAGMQLDLGAIAKGYAADQVVGILREAGVKRAIINLGGNVFAYGEKGEGKPWRIGIQDPNDDTGAYLGILDVTNKTVVSSGVYERFYEENGVRYHHILSPQTGYPVETDILQVSLVTSNSMKADALSTGIFAMGVEEGLSFVRQTEDLEAMFVLKSGTLIATEGFKEAFTLTNDNYSFE